MRRWGGLAAVTVLALLACGAVHAAEKFNRGLVAAVNGDGKAYLGWRLLQDDPAGLAFNVYRRTAGGKPVRVNPLPLAASTNLVDTAAPMDKENVWYVRPVAGGRERAPSEQVTLGANSPPNQVMEIKPLPI
jgi:hypothetical protein